MGVWIETSYTFTYRYADASHPAWVCGLKPPIPCHCDIVPNVTPCVGVWIETLSCICSIIWTGVTPCVGVWIETCSRDHVCPAHRQSHPAWVCGLKPVIRNRHANKNKSHPAWVCGLKQKGSYTGWQNLGHTLRGCVD